MAARGHLVELSHTISGGMITYKGLPGPVICDYLSREASAASYEGGTTFQIGRIDLVANTGTYLDCPFHRYADRADLSQIALERFVELPGVVVSLPHRAELAITEADVAPFDVAGKAVLFHTAWSDHWGTDQYFEQHPFLTQGAAESLQRRGAVLAGIDSHNIDDTRTRNSRPVHTVLLGHEVLIVEHLTGLEALVGQAFTFTAAPPRFSGVGTFPVRAYARISGVG
jgi:kynurenine formamidase